MIDPHASLKDVNRFILDNFEPAYLRLARNNDLQQKLAQAMDELHDCRACPRNCGIDRLTTPPRICQTGRHATISSAVPHFGEEDCLRGKRGSGTIFFSGCNLRCVFCQNWDISQQFSGREYTSDEIAEIMLTLQNKGCHNINFVTPEHVVPQVIEAIVAAIPLGLQVPIVYNTSAYDSLSSLQLLDGLVDIYMPDFKFWNRDSAKRLLKAKDYPERARAAISEMYRQVGALKLNRHGIALRGLLVRHLVMPGGESETKEIMHWLAEEVSPDTYVNIMGQYHPAFLVGSRNRKNQPQYSAIARQTSTDEMLAAHHSALSAGLWRIDRRQPAAL